MVPQGETVRYAGVRLLVIKAPFNLNRVLDVQSMFLVEQLKELPVAPPRSNSHIITGHAMKQDRI